MIRVKVIASLTLKNLKGCEAGETKLEVAPGTTVRNLLDKLGALPGEVGFVVRSGCIITDFETKVGDRDTLYLYPLIDGG